MKHFAGPVTLFFSRVASVFDLRHTLKDAPRFAGRRTISKTFEVWQALFKES
jgi:hypothetical protein